MAELNSVQALRERLVCHLITNSNKPTYIKTADVMDVADRYKAYILRGDIPTDE